MLGLLDLTSLGDDDDYETVRKLCDAALTVHGPVPAVCIWPRFVPLAHDELSASQVRIAAVANFPAGTADVVDVVAEAAQIVADGGDEVDVVYPWRDHIEHGPEMGRGLVAAVREAIGDDTVLKVILETGELDSPDAIASAARSAVDGGADFLKTSTGKTATGATPVAVHTVLGVINDYSEQGTDVGLKVSGGVRDLDTAASYLAMADDVMGAEWATADTMRFGASSLLADLLEALDGA